MDQSEKLPAGRREDLQPYRGSSGMRAWVVSTLLHTVLLVTVASLWRPLQRGLPGEGDRPVGIAVVRQTSAGSEYELVSADQASAASSLEAEATAASDATSQAAAESAFDQQIDAILGSLASAADGGAVDAAAASDVGSGQLASAAASSGGNNRRGSSQAQTSFMGVEATGASFAYVLDRSNSMSEFAAAPMRRARAELVASLQSLERVHQFAIIFYDDTFTSYRSSVSGNNGLIFANDLEKRAAREYIDAIKPSGGTEHFPALQRALQLAPEVIFFLTDGAEPSLSSSQIDRLVISAERAGTTIHAIRFGSGEADALGRWIQVLAERTGGQFRYVDASRL